mmetsp:Transcript_28291/g.27228  ORF Transcript_28291/g.27228 Transcript_28291/m.27228 type:complete len:88 (-) Transcript_28291:779-1042(-)
MDNLTFILFDKDNPTNETPLHWAVYKNNYRITQDIIKSYQESVDKAKNVLDYIQEGPILDLKNSNWHTPFFVAMIKGHLEIGELLLS